VRVLLLGGYGVFGARLARLLCRDGHSVTIAGRNPAQAQVLAEELGCAALPLDRQGALCGLKGHDVVIDAAGPFHAYGADPYRLPRAAIAAGLHYLDLSDDAAFCDGIVPLDEAARRAGLCVVSGLSTVPALSSAAVRSLAGTDTPLAIDCAILPGNRSPRGISVMTSILSQAGRPVRIWRGGAWDQASGWSEPADYGLPGGLLREGWLIEVPDLRLFPAHFKADTVIFRAGLELWVMRRALAAFAALRRHFPFVVRPWLVRLFKLAADLLAHFGSGRGGMSVTVIANGERRHWRLLAEEGDGPFIPGIAARALLRRASLPVGARPALEIVTLDEAEAAMSDLRVQFERGTGALDPVIPRVLGPTFATLPQQLRNVHLTFAVHRFRGRASVKRGTGILARLLSKVFGFPATAPDVPVEVVKTATSKGEQWERRFGTCRFGSFLAAGPQGLTERFGPFTFTIGLHVFDGALDFPVTGGRFGPIPLPRWLLPISIAREEARDERFQFDVKLLAPLTGQLIVHYRGWLEPFPSGEKASLREALA
jgi:hypothetical protein